jgi:hypothetical protein
MVAAQAPSYRTGIPASLLILARAPARTVSII